MISPSTEPAAKPATPRRGIRWFNGPDWAHSGPQAAVVYSPLASCARDDVYKKLPPGARNQMLVAKRWGAWGVFATDDWIAIHGRKVTPPREHEVKR